MLLDAGSAADIDAQDVTDGFTPLMRAAQGGHTEAVRLLLGGDKVDVSKLELEDSGAQVGFGRRRLSLCLSLCLPLFLSLCLPVPKAHMHCLQSAREDILI